MSTMSKSRKVWLEEKFGERANFNPTERMLYSHDIAAIPSMFKLLVGKTVPDAVVQPESEEELVEVVSWAAKHKIPLVPRGKGSSGYGGVVPTRKGVVVDFYRMKDVLSVDKENESVTVEPGITWEQLDKELLLQGLTLRLYPTSYPSSSVGGWLAQGGAGIGSYEFGWFPENVESARIVLPDGEVKDVSGKELELVADAEGTTGFISQVTLRVQKYSDISVAAFACPDAHATTRVYQQIITQDLPVWSVVFINPRMAEMKNRAPALTQHGLLVEPKVILSAAYITILAFRKADENTVMDGLKQMVRRCEGEILSQEIAKH